MNWRLQYMQTHHPFTQRLYGALSKSEWRPVPVLLERIGASIQERNRAYYALEKLQEAGLVVRDDNKYKRNY